MGLRPGGRFRRVRGVWRRLVCRHSRRRGRVRLGDMREREFWELVDEVFGHGYGRSLVQDQHLDALAGLTAAQALSAGEQPRVVWNVLCEPYGRSRSPALGLRSQRASDAVADETRGTGDIEQVFAYWGIVIHSAR